MRLHDILIALLIIANCTNTLYAENIPPQICIDVNTPDSSNSKYDNVMLAGEKSKFWKRGYTIRIRFLNGTINDKEIVKRYALQWCEFANIKFSFIESGEAEIRIRFDNSNQYYSYIGRDALNIPQNSHTMNFGWQNINLSESNYRRFVLHEFGHALGFIHEHQNPVAVIPWNKPAVYAYYQGPPNYWSIDKIDNNIFRKYSETITQYSSYDKLSIMHYWIPPEHLTDPNFIVPYNTMLSSTDKSYAAIVYPKDISYALSANNFNFVKADFSGDKKTDLIHFVNNTYCHIWQSIGNSSFSVNSCIPWQNYAIGSNNYNYLVGDFNGDGREDLIHLATKNIMNIWQSDALNLFNIKSFLPWPGYDLSANNFRFITGDFNGDKKTDLIHFVNNETANIWISNGNFTFLVKSFRPWATYGISANNYNYQTGDFNGDGKTDLIHFASNEICNIWQSNGDFTFNVKSFLPWSGYGLSVNNYRYSTGDLNGDGKTDIIHFVCNEYVNIWMSNGNFSFSVKSFRPWATYGISMNNYNYSTGDFNGDGRTDLIHFASNEICNIWQSNGDFTFNVKSFLPWSSYALSANNYKYITGDFNGDKRTDLIHFVSNETANIWTSNSNFTFNIKRYIPW